MMSPTQYRALVVCVVSVFGICASLVFIISTPGAFPLDPEPNRDSTKAYKDEWRGKQWEWQHNHNDYLATQKEFYLWVVLGALMLVASLPGLIGKSRGIQALDPMRSVYPAMILITAARLQVRGCSPSWQAWCACIPLALCPVITSFPQHFDVVSGPGFFLIMVLSARVVLSTCLGYGVVEGAVGTHVMNIDNSTGTVVANMLLAAIPVAVQERNRWKSRRGSSYEGAHAVSILVCLLAAGGALAGFKGDVHSEMPQRHGAPYVHEVKPGWLLSFDLALIGLSFVFACANLISLQLSAKPEGLDQGKVHWLLAGQGDTSSSAVVDDQNGMPPLFSHLNNVRHLKKGEFAAWAKTLKLAMKAWRVRQSLILFSALSSFISLSIVVLVPKGVQTSSILLPNFSSRNAAFVGILVSGAMIYVCLSTLMRDSGKVGIYNDRTYSILYPLKGILIMLKLVVQMTPNVKELGPRDAGTRCVGETQCIAMESVKTKVYEILTPAEEGEYVELAHLLLAFTTGIALLGALMPFVQAVLKGIPELQQKYVAFPRLASMFYIVVIFASQTGLAALLIGATVGTEAVLPLSKDRAFRNGDVRFKTGTFNGNMFSGVVTEAFGLAVVMVLANGFARASETPGTHFSASRTADGVRAGAALCMLLGFPGLWGIFKTKLVNVTPCELIDVMMINGNVQMWQCSAGNVPAPPLASYIASWCSCVVFFGSFALGLCMGRAPSDEETTNSVVTDNAAQ